MALHTHFRGKRAVDKVRKGSGIRSLAGNRKAR